MSSNNDTLDGIDLNQEEYRKALNIYTNDKVVVELCKSNNITKNRFVNDRENITELELFMGRFTCMLSVKHFPALKKLSIIHQNITRIEGLEFCPNLQYLWLNENRITQIEGLNNNTKLKELYLYNNEISKLQNLNLPRLEVLWIFDNNISKLENLDKLKNLRVLWAGRNQIEKLGTGLLPLENLEELNLAGNRIGRFKEIPLLDKLKNLKSLSLKCMDFGENPVCSLCNYQTYALYHLTHITKLDNLVITEQARHLADATFLKKKMYYNMRIKTLRRNTSNVIKKSASYMHARSTEINSNLNVLVRIKKELEREIQEVKRREMQKEDGTNIEEDGETDDYSATPAAEYLKELQVKMDVINNHIESKFQEIDDIQKHFNGMKQKIEGISDHNIRRLLVELDTGGNIRLEEGKSGDVWFHSCVDLVKSRFFAMDFEPLGIHSMKVNRVTRIHNRFLRNRFENHLESLVDISDQSYKRSLEYLFYTGEQNEIFNIVEDGFPSAKHYENTGMDAAVPLSNSVSVCELPRLLKDPRIKQRDRGEPIQGCLLIAKVFLGSFTHEHHSTASKTNSANATGASGLRSPSGGSKNRSRITASKYPNYDSIYRIKSGDSKQRMWFIFDNKLILPEYLIEYEFERDTTGSTAVESAPKYNPVDFILSEIKPQSDVDSMDIRSFASPFFNFASYCQSLYDQDSDVCSVALNMPPVLKARPKLNIVNEEVIKSVCKTTDFSSLTYLNLYGNGLKQIQGLEKLVNLRTLILSFNEIQVIEGLNTLTNLERLELGYNLIKRIDGLEAMLHLQSLELCNNLIYRLEDINTVKKSCPALINLNLKNNAICEVRSYRYIVIRRFPELACLDDKPVTEEEHQFAKERLNVLTETLILERITYGKQTEKGKKELALAGETGMLPAEEGWQNKVTDLDLSDLRLRRIQNIEFLTQLKKISFAHNEISRIEGLTECMKLEELNLEDNRVIKIEGLSSLLNLRRLELGKNKITKLENLDLLVRLTQLSIEDNEIESLNGIGKLVNLMELYIGNNRIQSIKEVHYLKKLPKLIILDMSGNELCREKNYRWYCIYNLRKLKVLDGISIDSSEISKAKSEFSGKITMDMLGEKVGHLKFDTVLELDLSSCGIKSISNLEPFTHLRDLNMEQNLLPSVQGIESLSSLVILRLSANRLEATHPAKNFAFGKFIGKLTHLEILTLDSNHISSIPALQLYKLTNLRVLSLRGNDIQKLEGLDGLTQLQELLLDKNKIRTIDEKALSGCPNLRQLHIEENSLRTLDGLRDLPNLHSLFLGCNRIIDLAEMDKLSSLVRLKEIVLSFNPIARKSLYRPSLIHKVPSLLFIDGKEVLSEERERSMLFFAQDYFQHAPPSGMPQGTMPTTTMGGVPTGTGMMPLPGANVSNVTGLGGTGMMAPTPVSNATMYGNAVIGGTALSGMQNAPNSRVPVRISSVNFEYTKDPMGGAAAYMAQGQPMGLGGPVSNGVAGTAGGIGGQRELERLLSHSAGSHNSSSRVARSRSSSREKTKRPKSKSGRSSGSSASGGSSGGGNSSTAQVTTGAPAVGTLPQGPPSRGGSSRTGRAYYRSKRQPSQNSMFPRV